MRLLSVRPPYAQAIFDAGKVVENRSWETDYRGTVYIHCSLKMKEEFFDCNGFKKSAKSLQKRMRDAYIGGQLFGGSIIGSVDLVACTLTSRSIWAESGSYHWILKNPRRLKKEIAHKGRLGLCTVDASLAARLRSAA